MARTKTKTKICDCGYVLNNGKFPSKHYISKQHKEWIAKRTDEIVTHYEDARETFSTGAVRRKVTTISRTDLIPLEALLALGERYHLGATVRGYGERNWEKGIGYSNLLQHAQVHLSYLNEQLVMPTVRGSASPDNPRQNAAAIMWAMAAIVHFLATGNPAESA